MGLGLLLLSLPRLGSDESRVHRVCCSGGECEKLFNCLATVFKAVNYPCHPPTTVEGKVVLIADCLAIDQLLRVLYPPSSRLSELLRFESLTAGAGNARVLPA